MVGNPRNRTRGNLVGLPDQACRSIRDQILKGRFALGSAISRRQFAAELGMSILPISDAVQWLVQEGLVESWPQVGTRIRIPSDADIRDRFVVREALESHAARLFAERAGMAECRELRELAAELDDLYRQRYANPENTELVFKVNTAHVQLHLRISECSGSVALCWLIESNNVLFYNSIFDLVGEQPPVPPHFHSDLIQAISSTDQLVADAAMRAHIRYNLEATIQNMRRITSQAESSWRLGRSKPAKSLEKVLIRAR